MESSSSMVFKSEPAIAGDGEGIPPYEPQQEVQRTQDSYGEKGCSSCYAQTLSQPCVGAANFICGH